MTRFLTILALCAALAGCGEQSVDNSAVADLGSFRLGHNIVIASKMKKVPISRDATEEEWVNSLTNALAERFERYEGDQLYHFGISVEGFALAPPGVPLVATPKSALVINITVWDDAEASKINEKPHQLLVLESLGEGPLVGSGFTNTREEQMENLSFNAARELEKWLSRQHQENGWFDRKSGTEPAVDDSAVTDDTVLPATEDSIEPVQEVAQPAVSETDEIQLDLVVEEG